MLRWLLALVIVASACGRDPQVVEEEGAEDPSAPVSGVESGLPSCDDERHLVVFDFFYTLTMGNPDQHEVVDWIQDPSHEPEERPGGVELARLYRELGYEILYVHMTPVPPSGGRHGVFIGDVPIDEAIAGWLEKRGFPVGQRARVWGWTWEDPGEDPSTTPVSVLISDLFDSELEDEVAVDVGYSAIESRVEALATSVPAQRLYTLGEVAGMQGTVPIPYDDLRAHVGVVEATTERVCRQAG